MTNANLIGAQQQQQQPAYGVPQHLIVTPPPQPIASNVAKATYGDSAAPQQQQQQYQQQQYATGYSVAPTTQFAGAQMQQQQQQPQQQQQQAPQQLPQTANVANTVVVTDDHGGRHAFHHGGKNLVGLSDLRELGKRALDIPQAAMAMLADRTKTRRYVVERAFSLRAMAENPQLAIIKLDDSNRGIFQMHEDAQTEERIGNLKTAVVLTSHLIQVEYNGDVALGVQVSNWRGNTYSVNSGKRCTFPVLPHAHHFLAKDTQGFPIHALTSTIDIRNLWKYGHLTLDHIRSTAVDVPGNFGFQFVSGSSPIIDLLRANAPLLRVNVDDCHYVTDDDNQKYFIIKKFVVDMLVRMMSRFFKQQPFTNLDEFSIQLSRLDGKSWDDATNLADYRGEQVATNALERRIVLAFVMEVQYVLAPESSALDAAIAATTATASAANSIDANTSAMANPTSGF